MMIVSKGVESGPCDYKDEIVVLKFSPKKKYGTPRHCFIFVTFLNKLSKTKFALICGG
jgi:hypothetical protein